MTNRIEAIAVLNNSEQKVQGVIKFIEQEKGVKVEINLKGLTPGLHGSHIHETGNLLDKCSTCKGHFNPYGKNHVLFGMVCYDLSYRYFY